MGAWRLWHSLKTNPYLPALGAVTGMQAVQMVQAGLKAIYVSGWQVAADANLAGQTFPDQSLYPSNSVPQLVRRINNALQRADQIQNLEEKSNRIDWFTPLVADAEAGFGGPLNAFELMKDMIDAGAAAVHFEDQMATEKKCGHLGGKVLVPTGQAILKLVAARLAADTADVPTLIIARTDAAGAKLVTSDVDQRDHEFLTGERTSEGYYRTTPGIDSAIARGISYAPYADLVWCETSSPSLVEAQRFADGVHSVYPNKWLAYNCSSSFNWESFLKPDELATFQQKLGEMGYKFQFITLAGFHSLSHSMFRLSKDYAKEGMPAYVQLQREEFRAEQEGYTAVRHQSFVGTGYYDEVAMTITGGTSSTTAMQGSTEKEQFKHETPTAVTPASSFPARPSEKRDQRLSFGSI